MGKYNTEMMKFISHEVKNQLSICDLYTEIIKKYCAKNDIKDETILTATKNIKKAIMLANNSMLELKTFNKLELKQYDIKDIITEAVDLSKVYTITKQIDFSYEIINQAKILCDKNKFVATIINLVKNACEAFDEEDKNKKISILVEQKDEQLHIIVSNTAKPIEEPDKIFNEGFTTKSTGNGLGLVICKNNMQEMGGNLELNKSDINSTKFKITIRTKS